MAASATLNTGHHWRSTKSITRPRRKPPPERKARSQRFPTAPPITKPTAIRATPTAVRASEPTSTITTTNARTPMIGPSPWPRENAIPELNVRLNRSVHTIDTM
jgi:hypothetical protein